MTTPPTPPPPPGWGPPPSAPGWGAPQPAPGWGAQPPGWGSAPPGPGPGAPPWDPVGWGPTANLPRADFWSRLGAFLLDGVVVTGASAVVGVPLLLIGIAGTETETSVCTDLDGGSYLCDAPTGGTIALWLLLFLVYALFALAVWFLLLVRPLARTGQTIGRRAVGIRVLGELDGQPIGIGKAIVRELFARWISASFCYLGYLWMLWDARSQTWHDKVVGTVVVKDG